MDLGIFAIGMPGPMEMLIVLAILLLLFGGARLPSLMRNLGRSATEFRRGMTDDPEPEGASRKDLEE